MTPVAYDEDFFEWAVRSAELIRSPQGAGETSPEMAGQPEGRETATWRSTIRTQRSELESVLKDSPSLRPYLAGELQKRYRLAVGEA